MAKEKITLDDLKVDSFLTELDEQQMHNVKGGAVTIRGRRFNYTVRWTSIDIRAGEPAVTGFSGDMGG